jgi:hypothetical protein
MHFGRQKVPTSVASKSQIWEAFGSATGGSAATYAKSDRSMIRHSRSFPGGQGGGANTKHGDAHYLAGITVATASPFPSLAGADVDAAHLCTYFGSAYSITDHHAGRLPDDVPQKPFEVEQLQRQSFADCLAGHIEWLADNGPAEPHSINGRRIDFDNSWIRIDFAPFAAQMSWQLPDGLGLTHYFLTQAEVDVRRHLAPKEAARQLSRVRRSALVSASLLLTAAELLTDARSKLGGNLPFSRPGKASPNAASENEKVPGQPRPRASTPHKALPYANTAA